MKNGKVLEENEKLLVEAFSLQNYEAYDEAFEKLQSVAHNLITMIESVEKNSEFYMRVMPIMKQERQLISQHDYRQFINKNEKTLSKSFQKNAYLALLMQEMQEKTHQKIKKWNIQEETLLQRMILSQCSLQEVQQRFSQYDTKEVRKKYIKVLKKYQKNEEKKEKVNL